MPNQFIGGRYILWLPLWRNSIYSLINKLEYAYKVVHYKLKLKSTILQCEWVMLQKEKLAISEKASVQKSFVVSMKYILQTTIYHIIT